MIYEETHDVPQIPWAKKVKVTGAHYWTRNGKIDSVELKSPEFTASILANGRLHLRTDSKIHIKRHMKKSDPLTKSMRNYRKKFGGFFLESTVSWLAGKPTIERPWGFTIPGVIDWVPGMEKDPYPMIGQVGKYGSGVINDISEDWIGSSFPYVHFKLPGGRAYEYEEGLAIDWVGKAAPEVWVGLVDEFIQHNTESLDNWDHYAYYNQVFENGLIWALDYMGVFESDRIPDWAVKILQDDPDRIWPDLADKLRAVINQLPHGLQMALWTKGHW